MYEREYPYIHAWGINLGSFPYYRNSEAEIATADGVPSDVTYRRDFSEITQPERDDALRREADGTAVVLREGGEPFRVWYRVNGIASAVTRGNITTTAERLRAGKPARG